VAETLNSTERSILCPRGQENMNSRQTAVSLVESETPIPGINCPQSYALDHTAFRELAIQKKYGNPLSLE